ncbi:ABC transporter ATP-binding protein [Pelistega europaea]|nr:ABC transporter ATP-binding protein [Pelistega europaea]
MNFIFEWFENRINPYPEEEPIPPKKGVVPFIISGLSGLKKYLLLLIVFSAVIGAFEALLFKFMGSLVDWMGHYNVSQLWAEKSSSIITMAVLVLLFPAVVGLSSCIRFQSLQGVFPMRLRWNYHRLMLGQSLAFYQDEFAGRVSAKVMQTALAVRDVVMSIADMMVYVAVYFLTVGVILLQFDGWLILPFLVWLLMFVVALFWFIPRLAKSSRIQADARSLMTGRVTDAYANIQTVKLFSYDNREIKYAKDSMQEFLGTVHGQMRYVTLLEVANQTMNMTLLAGTAGIGLWLWMNGSVSVGAIAAATAMSLRVHGLSHWMMWESARLFENLGTVQDGMNTLSKPRKVLDKVGAPKLTVSQGEIVFDHVNFTYTDGKTLLQDFNLTIRPGEKVGLVGRSGAGKSTLMNLLLRFYDINSGQIRIDGQNIADVQQESLRRHIGLVTQDTSLLHRSVRDNIKYGRVDASDAEMQEAACRAQAAEFIPALRDAKGRTGYDAYVGERGVKLSGGQRQRIAIARVMLKNAPILILDEATSALDSEVELAIQDSLSELMENKTVIAIAHRLSTIAMMDRLIVMDKGQIVEQGTHQELLARNGVYAKLWAHQSGGFLQTHAE